MQTSSPLDWLEVVLISFQDLWRSFIGFVPSLIGALLVLVIGLVIAIFIGRLTARLIEVLFIEKLIEQLKIKDAIKKMGFNLNFAKLIGWLVKWFLIIVFFIAAADILGLPEVTIFLNTVVLYVPTAVAAALILFVGLVLAAFVGEVVQKALKVSKLHSGHLMAAVAKWAIVVFTVMTALVQLGIARELIQIILMGLVAMLALAGGLAFGLGGKEWAQDMLARIQKDIGKK